jgi:hypothetical protein
MLGRRPRAEETTWEAMAEGLTLRGDSYRYGLLEFPPGVWVEVPATAVAHLRLVGWAQVREKEAASE